MQPACKLLLLIVHCFPFIVHLMPWWCPQLAQNAVQVYAAEAEAASAKAARAQAAAAKQAEDAWNCRIKGAYAALAASTPYRPAVTKKPASHALSWHRSARFFKICMPAATQAS